MSQSAGMSHDLLAEALPSWRRAMGGANRSRATIDLYSGGVGRVPALVSDQQRRPQLTKDAVNAFITDLLAAGAQPAHRARPAEGAAPVLARGRRRAEGGSAARALARPQQTTKVVDALDDGQLARLFSSPARTPVSAISRTTASSRRSSSVVPWQALKRRASWPSSRASTTLVVCCGRARPSSGSSFSSPSAASRRGTGAAPSAGRPRWRAAPRPRAGR